MDTFYPFIYFPIKFRSSVNSLLFFYVNNPNIEGWGGYFRKYRNTPVNPKVGLLLTILLFPRCQDSKEKTKESEKEKEVEESKVCIPH